MSWQKIAEHTYSTFCTTLGFNLKYEDLTKESKKTWELAARQAVWSWQMGMLQKDPELMVVLIPEMKQ